MHRTLPTCRISLKSKKRVDVRTDGQTFETGFIRSTLSKSRPNKGNGTRINQRKRKVSINKPSNQRSRLQRCELCAWLDHRTWEHCQPSFLNCFSAHSTNPMPPTAWSAADLTVAEVHEERIRFRWNRRPKRCADSKQRGPASVYLFTPWTISWNGYFWYERVTKMKSLNWSKRKHISSVYQRKTSMWGKWRLYLQVISIIASAL